MIFCLDTGDQIVKSNNLQIYLSQVFIAMMESKISQLGSSVLTFLAYELEGPPTVQLFHTKDLSTETPWLLYLPFTFLDFVVSLSINET